MIEEILALAAFLVENCTGVVLLESQQNDSIQDADSETTPLENENDPSSVQNLVRLEQQSTIFQEYDPPQHLENHPRAWRQSLPAFSKSFWECLKSVLLIQGLAGTLIGMAGIVLIIFEHTTNYCYFEVWDKIPDNMQQLKVTGSCIEAFTFQTFDFFFLLTLFPSFVIKKLGLLTFCLLVAFVDISYRLFLVYFYGHFTEFWTEIPSDMIFFLLMSRNHFRVARYFQPRSSKDTKKLFFVITAQLFLGTPVACFLAYRLLPLYIEQKESTKMIIATFIPLIMTLPKVVCRLCAQRAPEGAINPGHAYVLIACMYGVFATVFRVMQAELTSIGLFIALGIAHAIIDLLERITITMRDHIWEYLYRLVRRQRSRPPKYRSPRCRRFIADVSIQIMMQESTALITALGFFAVYRLIYDTPKAFTKYEAIFEFLTRAAIGLLIDLVFNVISLLIQTRVMNIAVNRVWKKKWRRHIVVNSLGFCISILFFGKHLIFIVNDKYQVHNHFNGTRRNCTFPNFLQEILK